MRTPLRKPRRLRLLVVVACLALLPACSIPTDASPKTIPSLPNNPPAPPSAATGPVGGLTATIYYLQQGHLKGVTRAVTNLSPATLLTLLVQEPTAEEAVKEKIVNALSPNDALGLASSNTTSGDLTVQLPDEIRTLEGSQLYDAYGEIVWTLLDPTNNKDCAYTGVQFLLDGQPWPALLPNFTAKLLVTRSDYEKIRDPSTPAPNAC